MPCVTVLSGFVTDHVELLQLHSKMYHNLAAFEKDAKRRLAMESRRVDLLWPLLLSLSETIYEGFHRQASFVTTTALDCSLVT